MFSFALIQRLIGGEFNYHDEHTEQEVDELRAQEADKPAALPGENGIEGLQAALQAYVLVPGEDDDHFR